MAEFCTGTVVAAAPLSIQIENGPLLDGKLYNLPFNMNTFYQLWGVKTPAEAKAKIEEQRKEFDHIATPANLEEQALKLCGKDI